MGLELSYVEFSCDIIITEGNKARNFRALLYDIHCKISCTHYTKKEYHMFCMSLQS